MASVPEALSHLSLMWWRLYNYRVPSLILFNSPLECTEEHVAVGLS
jgi:hypothetical protein